MSAGKSANTSILLVRWQQAVKAVADMFFLSSLGFMQTLLITSISSSQSIKTIDVLGNFNHQLSVFSFFFPLSSIRNDWGYKGVCFGTVFAGAVLCG